MNYQDRILDDMQYFHGTIEAARVTYAGSCKTCGTSIPTVVEDFATVMILGLQWKP